MLDIFKRLVIRNDKRTEADIQADVRQFILTAPFELEVADVVALESPLGDRRRIDVEAGSTVIEVKRDLRREKVKREAEEQLAGYVEVRTAQTGLRYVGSLTDGTQWLCYDLVDGQLRQVTELIAADTSLDLNRLVAWLEGVLATTTGIARHTFKYLPFTRCSRLRGNHLRSILFVGCGKRPETHGLTFGTGHSPALQHSLCGTVATTDECRCRNDSEAVHFRG